MLQICSEGLKPFATYGAEGTWKCSSSLQFPSRWPTATTLALYFNTEFRVFDKTLECPVYTDLGTGGSVRNEVHDSWIKEDLELWSHRKGWSPFWVSAACAQVRVTIARTGCHSKIPSSLRKELNFYYFVQEQTLNYPSSIWQMLQSWCVALSSSAAGKQKSAPVAPHFTPRFLSSDHSQATKPTCSPGNSQALLTAFGKPVQGWFSLLGLVLWVTKSSLAAVAHTHTTPAHALTAMLENTTLSHSRDLILFQALWTEENINMGEGIRNITKTGSRT